MILFVPVNNRWIVLMKTADTVPLLVIAKQDIVFNNV